MRNLPADVYEISSFICETFRRMYMKYSDVVYPKWQVNNDYFDVQIYVLLGVC